MIPTTTEYGTALSDIVRCEACGHMQLERFPDDAVLAEAYSEAESVDYVLEEAGQRATANAILATIERHTPPDTLVDLGCWVGYLPAEAERRGWRAIGVEPSAFASEYARKELGVDVRRGDLFDTELEPGAFAAVFLGDVIEHVRDTAGALDRAAGLVAPEGVLAMTLPDAGSRVARMLGARWWSVIPTHVQYFTRDSMRTLLNRQGWKVVEITTAPKAFTVRYYLQRVGGYREGVAAALVRGAAAVGLADRLWAPDFRDRMLVIARRAGG